MPIEFGEDVLQNDDFIVETNNSGDLVQTHKQTGAQFKFDVSENAWVPVEGLHLDGEDISGVDNFSTSSMEVDTVETDVDHQGNDLSNLGSLEAEEAVIEYGDTIGINAGYFGELSDSSSDSVNALAGETGIETVIVPEGEYQLMSRFNDFDNISWIIGMGEGSVIKPHDETDEENTTISSYTHLAHLNFVAEPDSVSRTFRMGDTGGEWPIENERRILRDCRFEAVDQPLSIATERIVATGISAIADEGNDAVRFDPSAEDCIIDGSIVNGSISISSSAENIIEGDNIVL